MFSPSVAHPRQAPPVRPSRSLEGLEKTIPPQRPSRPELQLNKPLPAKPLPEAPLRPLTTWSDDSSTIDSFGSPTPRESRVSSESYPIFVSSGSDDLYDLVDQQPSNDDDDDAIPIVGHLSSPMIHPPTRPTTAGTAESSSSPELKAFLSEERYGRQTTNWTQNQSGTNHYFREKKWDFFPELATPSALGRPASSGLDGSRKRRKDGSGGRLNLAGFDFRRNRSRWTTADRGKLALAHEVRDSIRSYVHRTISKKGSYEKINRPPRPVTAPSDFPYDHFSPPKTPALTCSDRSESPSSGTKQGTVHIYEQMRTLSVSTDSSLSLSQRCPTPNSSNTIPMHRKKQLAVPLSPYQKYGATIWEKQGGKKRHNVRFPRYQDHKRVPSSVTREYPKHVDTTMTTYSNMTPPLSPPLRSQLQQNTRECVRVLQDGTSHVLGALDGAKKKISETQADRRRAHLKSKIRLIGPVNPYTTYGRVDPWV